MTNKTARSRVLVGVLSEYLTEEWHKKLKEEYFDANAEQLIYMDPTARKRPNEFELDAPVKTTEKVRHNTHLANSRSRRRNQL